jgi:PhnB protein
MPIKPVPEGYHTATPYLIITGAAKALEYYQKAFGAEIVFRMDGPGGTIAHAEIKIGDSMIMLGEESPKEGFRSATSLGGSPVGIMLYVADVDARFEKAVAAGGKVSRPVVDQFYGDRSGTLTDPFGHIWTIATHVEDVPPAEMKRRAEEYMKKKHAGGA